MNNNCIIAWMDDMHMSAHLAKVSTTHSYDLRFCEKIEDILDFKSFTLLIDLNKIKEQNFKQIDELRQRKSITFIGFCEELNQSLIVYFKKLGCDMVFKRHDLMKNLNSILINIFHSS